MSLRRSKQFAIGPGTNTRVDVDLNLKGTPGTEGLQEQRPGGMCTHNVRVTAAAEVDPELLGWIRQAYDAAG